MINLKLIISDKFHNTATYLIFKKWLDLIVVNKAHLMSKWGRNFHSIYMRLGQLWSLFEDDISWFTCFATLDAETLNKVKKRAGFNKNIMIMCIFIN